MTVAYTRLRELAADEIALLPDAERNRDFGSSDRRQQYRCGRALLRRLLEDLTGQPASSHELATSEHGKPVCVGGPAVSISHAGDVAACAVTDTGEVGVDLEYIDERRATAKVANKFFSADESAWLESQPADRFYMLWVLKEAWVKTIGGSVFGDVNRLRCRVEPPRIEAESDDGFGRAELYATRGGFLAVTTTGASRPSVEMRQWVAGVEGWQPAQDFLRIATSDGTERKAKT